jgi:uroporphyrin-III C-methyltransferase
VTVFLVGAGPGDPELISVRGARLLGSADVVLHDSLARPLVALARPGAEILDVGKSPGSTPVPQSQINRLLVEHGRRSQRVVRLKGGDPFVFARGAEEVRALQAAGIENSVVPGISAALAGPTSAGVPLTLRGLARAFTVLTGHEDPANWSSGYAGALVALRGTIVVMMGTTYIRQIARRLMDAGLSPDTPVAAVRAATTRTEEICRSTLAGIDDVVLPSPLLFVIGGVAGIDLRPLAPNNNACPQW